MIPEGTTLKNTDSRWEFVYQLLVDTYYILYNKMLFNLFVVKMASSTNSASRSIVLVIAKQDFIVN